MGFYDEPWIFDDELWDLMGFDGAPGFQTQRLRANRRRFLLRSEDWMASKIYDLCVPLVKHPASSSIHLEFGISVIPTRTEIPQNL